MRNLVTLIILLGFAGTFMVFWDSPPEVFLEKPVITAQELPKANSYMLITDTIKYSSSGEKDYTLQTTETRYFQKKDRFELEMPSLLTFDKNNPLRPWLFQANRGNIYNGGEKAVFNDNVFARQYAKLGEENELRTSRLVFFPDKQLAESNKRVTISTPNGTTSGTGLRADMSNERFKLLSKVKGLHYAQ